MVGLDPPSSTRRVEDGDGRKTALYTLKIIR